MWQIKLDTRPQHPGRNGETVSVCVNIAYLPQSVSCRSFVRTANRKSLQQWYSDSEMLETLHLCSDLEIASLCLDFSISALSMLFKW